MQHLDAQSQQTVRAFTLRALLVSGYVLVGSALGLLSFTQACGSLSMAFTLAAILDVLTATWRRERAGRGSLNGWDEALTFNGIALFTHMLQQLQP